HFGTHWLLSDNNMHVFPRPAKIHLITQPFTKVLSDEGPRKARQAVVSEARKYGVAPLCSKRAKSCRVARIGGRAMAMLSETDLLDSIFETVLRGCNVDVKARKNAIWNACLAMMADVLRETDPFNRERLLRDLVPDLRQGVVEL